MEYIQPQRPFSSICVSDAVLGGVREDIRFSVGVYKKTWALCIDTTNEETSIQLNSTQLDSLASLLLLTYQKT